jgi:hypothetical protein
VPLAIALAIPGCGFVHDESIDGPYRLIAVDVDEQLSVCYKILDGCLGRISETVYAVGHDALYVVAARHPISNRKATEYFYLIRALDGPSVDPSVTVRGPFDAANFAAERVRMHLPAFDREIASLK